ncbi:MAG: hypothetical protein JNK25_09290 [Phycisphaerae bacterium]|nr:hypothetical protein [Phycisphaerae bacterium]
MRITHAVVAAAAAIAPLAGAQTNVLLNPGFEDRCTVARDWTQFGNVQNIDFYFFSGIRAVKMFGPFCCPIGYSGFFQDAPAAEGQVWEASGMVLNPDWDALSWNDNGTPDDINDDRGTRVFLEIQFFDSGGAQITGPQEHISSKLSGPTAFTHVMQTVPPAVAPAGTARVRLVAIAEQANWVGGAAWYDDFVLNQVGGGNVLSNPSFETQVANCLGSPFAGWVNFGNGQANADENPRTGTYAAKLFGGYNAPVAGSGWLQNVPTIPGTMWKASGWATTSAGDTIADGNDVFLTIEFFNANGDNITGYEVNQHPWRSEPVATGAANDLLYHYFETGEVEAPEGTATVRCLIYQRQVEYAGGATWWDDMELIQTDAVTCYADYNQDGGVDGGDVEAFYNDWEQGLEAADVNGDGGVDGGDVETFFTQWEAGGCQ